MATNLTYKTDIKEIINPFRNNRINKIDSIDSSSEYLSYNDEFGYIYANKSSDDFTDTYSSNIILRLSNNSTYTLYTGYSYTYTEIVQNNPELDSIYIANEYLTLNDRGHNDYAIRYNKFNPQHKCKNGFIVNHRSDILSYYITSSNSINNKIKIELDDEVKPKIGYIDIKSLFNSTDPLSTCYYELCAEYDRVEQLDIYDGEIKSYTGWIGEGNVLEDIHVFSSIDGYDHDVHKYGDAGNVNAYVYIVVDDRLGSNIGQVGSGKNNVVGTGSINPQLEITKSTGISQKWGIEYDNSNLVKVTETAQTWGRFYDNLKYDTYSFDYVYHRPSLRSNSGTCEFYVPIKLNGNVDTNYNYQSAKFRKRIGDLPVHIIDDTLHIRIIPWLFYLNDNESGLSGSSEMIQRVYGKTFADNKFTLTLNCDRITICDIKLNISIKTSPFGSKEGWINDSDMSINNFTISDVTLQSTSQYIKNVSVDNNIIELSLNYENIETFLSAQKYQSGQTVFYLDNFSILLTNNNVHNDGVYLDFYNGEKFNHFNGAIFRNLNADTVDSIMLYTENEVTKLVGSRGNDNKIFYYELNKGTYDVNNESDKMKRDDDLSFNNYVSSNPNEKSINHLTIVPFFTLHIGDGSGGKTDNQGNGSTNNQNNNNVGVSFDIDYDENNQKVILTFDDNVNVNSVKCTYHNEPFECNIENNNDTSWSFFLNDHTIDTLCTFMIEYTYNDKNYSYSFSGNKLFN